VFGRRSLRLSKEVRRLEGDVASAQRSLRESPYTVESLRAETEAIRRLLHERARKAHLLAKQREEEAEEKAAASAAASAAAAAPLGPEAPAGVAVPGSGGGGGVEEVAAELDDAAATQQVSKAAVPQLQQQEEEEEMEVEEGQEVEGGFDLTPELKSRFADKSSSLRFVTAEEDARMRKEELAKVFAVRNQAAAGDEKEPSSSLAGVTEASEGASSNDGEGQEFIPADGAAPDDGASRAEGDAGEGQGDTGWVGGTSKGRMKAFGAILEKTLSQSLLGRAPPSGSSAAAGARPGVGRVASGKMRALMSPQRQQQQQQQQQGHQSEKTATKILTPPCKPKSKFFRSIQSPSGPSASGDVGADGSSGPLVPPPPAPMMGLLSQIRARGGEEGGTGSGSNSAGEVKAGMGGLLAQIRAGKGGRGSVSGDSGFDGGEGSSSAQGQGKDSGIVPPPLPQAPAPPLPARSLFSAASPSTAAVSQAPPPDFLAQLRAKAAEKQALRLAAAAETNG